VASNVAPPSNTGGGGFVFEVDVCAFFSRPCWWETPSSGLTVAHR
jgi:hypothetical protein